MQISCNRTVNDGYLRFQQCLGGWDEMYALGWRIQDVPTDPLTRLLMHAKSSPTDSVVSRAVSHYVKSLPFDSFYPNTIVVPVPGHLRTRSVRGTIQWQLTVSLCRHFNFIDGTDLIQRERDGRSFSRNQLKENERIEELDALNCIIPDGVTYSRAIVVDDFTTTGQTALAVCRLLRRFLDAPPKITVVVLGKHEKREVMSNLSNNHLSHDGFWAAVDSRKVYRT